MPEAALMGTSLAPPITSRADLIAFAARLDGVAEVGFDTEFHSEQTYWPKVMLLQFSTKEEVVLVDPLAPEVRDTLGGFLEIIRMREQTILGHALDHDLEIFMRLSGGLPAKVFDTQLAAAMVGLGGPISLGALLQGRLGTEVGKLYSRADWGKRPLPAAQAEYAADDVRYLHQLADGLRSDLEARGRLAAFSEECSRLLDPKRFMPADPARAWHRVGRKPPPGTRARAVMTAVAAERERIAQETDRHPRRVLSDDVVVDLARRAPTEKASLDADTRRRPAPNLEKYAERWLDAVRTGLQLPLDVEEGPGLENEGLAAVDLARWVARWSLEREGVAAWLLPSWDEDLAEVVRKPPRDAQELCDRLSLTGWRRDILEAPLWSVLGGGEGIFLRQGEKSLVAVWPARDPS